VALRVVELLIIGLVEMIGVIVFYNTGEILIRIFTFCKITFPILGHNREEKQKLRYGWICYLSGFSFYIFIFSIFILVLKNITS
jgi:hypothetical protein